MSERPPTDVRGLDAAIIVAEHLPSETDGTASIVEVAQRRKVLLGYLAEAKAQRAGEGEAKRLFDGHTEGDECDCPFPNWCLFEAGYKAAQRAGEPPTPDDVERAAKAMQAIGHDRWRGSVWEAGMGWRTLAWDEVRDDEKRFVRELARAALESRDGS